MRYLAVFVGFLLSAVAGTLAALPVFVMGLVVPMTVIWPLTLGVAALAAALGAGWAGNLLARDGTWSRLPRILVAAETTAAVLLVVSAIPFVVRVPGVLLPSGPAIYGIALTAAVISLVATVAMLRYRSAEGRPWRDVLLTLALLMLVAPAVCATVVLLSCSLLVRCGA